MYIRSSKTTTMKKSLLTIACGIAGMAYAQQPVTNMQQATIHHAGSQQVQVVDTITDYLDRATAFYNLSAGSQGYVLGTSAISTETGEHYDNVGTVRVTELMVYFVAKEQMGNADMVTGYVYASGTDSLPAGTALGSGQISIANCDTSGFPTFIPLSNYAPQAGAFVVSIEYGSIDDTISIFSSNPTTQSGGPDGAGERRCCQKTQLGWMHAADIWSIAATSYNADALIIPIVDINSSTGPAVLGGVSVSQAFPSPALNNVAINLSSANTQDVAFNVYNSNGQIVHTANYTVNGSQQINLDVTDWAAGNYYYTVATSEGTIGSKFQVVK